MATRFMSKKNAGIDSGFKDSQYIEAGAKILDAPADVYDISDMGMHIKEPQPSEYGMIKKDQIVFTYLHLAAEKELTNVTLPYALKLVNNG